jgi:PQ loop repeat
MATQVISGLVNVSKHGHDIGLCPRLDVEGVAVVRWIAIVSGQCVYGKLGAVSWIFGIWAPLICHVVVLHPVLGNLSILSWLFAQMPQVISNYLNGSVDGLSPMFLTNWFLVRFISRILAARLTHSAG